MNSLGTAVPFTVTVKNLSETLELGQKLSLLLKPGDVVGLVGPLAAGKTWFAKGIALGLGVPEHEYLNSPAFDLVHEYVGNYLPVYHMDLYRLDFLTDEDVLWLHEYLNGGGICIIEWANKFIDRLIGSYLRVDLFVKGTEERQMCFQGFGAHYEYITQRLAQL